MLLVLPVIISVRIVQMHVFPAMLFDCHSDLIGRVWTHFVSLGAKEAQSTYTSMEYRQSEAIGHNCCLSRILNS
jgi:hypothetical protein